MVPTRALSKNAPSNRRASAFARFGNTRSGVKSSSYDLLAAGPTQAIGISPCAASGDNLVRFRFDSGGSILKRLVVFLALISGFNVSTASAQVPPGSYLQSCSNVRFDGAQLNAICADRQGRRVPSTLMVGRCAGGISNDNGQLSCQAGAPRDYGRDRFRDEDDGFDTPRRRPPPREYGGYREGPRLPAGSWRASCTNVDMRGFVLSATCATARGNYQPTSADVRECPSFSNRNGNLVCD